MKEIVMVDWYGCYGEGWTGEIVGEAFSHPAKFARGLIRRIYGYALERGWLAEGDVVVDPFAGVALGALDAMFRGLHWVGNELEEKFVDLGQRNIDLWNRRYNNGMLPRWGTATLLQGDSRELVVVLDGARARAMACVSSPPYATKTIHDRGGLKLEHFKEPNRIGKTSHAVGECKMDDYSTNPRNLGNMREGDYAAAIVSSPPYISSISQSDTANDADTRIKRKAAAGVDVAKPVNIGGPNSVLRQSQVYGQSPGQLAAMAEGDVDAFISSPPYSPSGLGHDTGEMGDAKRAKLGLIPNSEKLSKAYLAGRRYGQSPGQLATMPEGAFEASAVVSSPPYEESMSSGQSGIDWTKTFDSHRRNRANEPFFDKMPGGGAEMCYSDTADNLGNAQGDTFWSAALVIVQQCHQVLVPGGVAIWVLKAFVRNKQIVDFPDQWRRMCEAVGFEMLEWIRAWVVEERGAQYALNGDLEECKVERKSFFRRLYELKTRAAKFWESVDRNSKAVHLRQVHRELWEDYRRRLKLPDEEPPYPTRSRILSAAQMAAYVEAGKPDMEIETQIDFEVVLVMRKRGGAEVRR